MTGVGDVNKGTKDRGNIGVIVAAMPPEYDAADVATPECAVKAIHKPAEEVSEQPPNAASKDTSDSYSENSMLAVAAGCGDSNRGDVDDEEMKEKIPYPHVMPPSISPASATILADITTAGMVSSSAGESKINGDTV